MEEKRRSKRHGSDAAHTRVPNLIYDIVCPLLDSSEKDCLLYILRRTYGFADPQGGRKKRDTISLDQFEKGIISGNYLLDLGTGLSRNTIRKALKDLEEKELILTSYSCLKCLWEENDSSQKVEISEKTNAARCPRCGATLSRAYGLAPLTPKKLLHLLNTKDPSKRIWSWEEKSGRFVFEDARSKKDSEQIEKDLREEAIRVRNSLWHPELVDEAAARAGKRLKTGKVSLSRRLNNFYKPVWEFQEEYGNPPLIKYALEQTIRSGILDKKNNQRWYRYLKAVLENQKSSFTGEEDPSNNPLDLVKQKEEGTKELLQRAARLNGKGNEAEARALLADILAQVKELAPLFDNRTDLCDASLREAYKRGVDYFVGIEPPLDDIGQMDFYPEWSWPEGLQPLE